VPTSLVSTTIIMFQSVSMWIQHTKFVFKTLLSLYVINYSSLWRLHSIDIFSKCPKRISWYWDTLLSHYFEGAQCSRKIFYFKLASTQSCKSWKEIFDIISSFWIVHDMIFKLPCAWLRVVLTIFWFYFPTPHNFQERSFFSTNESSLGLIMMFFSLFCLLKE
jgi:hypothetical protein